MIEGKYRYQESKVKQLFPESLLEEFKPNEKSFFLAGGAITSIFTNKEVNDLDIYPKTKMAYFKLLDFMYNRATILSCTEKSVYGMHSEDGTNYNINVINLGVFDEAEDIFKNFDFSIVKGAFDVDNDTFYFDDNFFVDLASRRISISPSTLYPLMSVIRVDKYVKRGFSVSLNEMTKALLMVSKLSIKTIDDAEKHIGGLYGVSLRELFKDKEFSLDSLIEILQDPEVRINKESQGLNKEACKKLKCIREDLLKEVCDELNDGAYFNHNGLLLKMKSTFEFEVVSAINDDIFVYLKENSRRLVPSEKDFIYIYKDVELKDGKLFSFYKNQYEYKLNEECSADSHGKLYFYKEKKYEYGQYYKKKNSVNLTCKALISDIKSFDGSMIKVEKCIPLEYSLNENK